MEDSEDGGTPPPDPCGAFGEDFTRCEANPLYTAGNAHSDGRLELFIADPSVMYDEDEQLWKAWWREPPEGLRTQTPGPKTPSRESLGSIPPDPIAPQRSAPNAATLLVVVSSRRLLVCT